MLWPLTAQATCLRRRPTAAISINLLQPESEPPLRLWEGANGLAFDRAGNLFVTALRAIVGTTLILRQSINLLRPEYEPPLLPVPVMYPSVWPSTAEAICLWRTAIGGDPPVRVYKFTPAGVRSTFASVAGGLAIDSADNLFVADGASGNILKFTPERSAHRLCPGRRLLRPRLREAKRSSAN